MATPDETRIFFFGDSICVGQYVSLHKGWVTQLSAAFADFGEARGHRISVTNASASGRITREALERMPYEIQSQHPDIVIIQFGMNDCNHWAFTILGKSQTEQVVILGLIVGEIDSLPAEHDRLPIILCLERVPGALEDRPRSRAVFDLVRSGRCLLSRCALFVCVNLVRKRCKGVAYSSENEG